MLPFLRYWVRESKRFSCLVNFAPFRSFFFIWNEFFLMEFTTTQRCSIFDHSMLWVKIRHRIKSACSESNQILCKAVDQNRRPVLEKAVSGPSAQLPIKQNSNFRCYHEKLGNNLWIDSELIETKDCSQICRKWNAIFESHLVWWTGKTSILI